MTVYWVETSVDDDVDVSPGKERNDERPNKLL